MTTISNKEQRLIKKYQRDNNLMFPFHVSDAEDQRREAFIKDLIRNEHLIKTVDKNSERFEDSFITTVKKLNRKNIISILLLGLLAGVFGFNVVHEKNKDATSLIQNKTKDTATDVAIITAFLLAGLAVGGGVVVAIKQANTEISKERFYHRMVVRLFDEFKKYHPELNESILKSCNPEMARVITTLLFANMDKKDTLKIFSIAEELDEHKYHTNYTGEIAELKIREKALKEALVIVEKNLLDNPWLKETVLNVYNGKVPATFVPIIQEQQKIK